ncbi:MAG TPA: hypothetical protein VHK69_07600 [Chitinophagaceae bacterium]|jgi:hypothetical protein|nr:hypothetical protein [Chitinophagaceae bacterium]
MNRIPAPHRTDRTATWVLIAVLSLFILLHLVILFGLVPYSAVWGGRLTSREQMVRFETISLFVNGLMLLIVLIRARHLSMTLPHKFLSACIWIMAVLFTLNTIGNAASQNSLERWAFTPMTLVLALTSGWLAWRKADAVRKG